MSYIVEYTSFSGKKVPVLHKVFESANEAQAFGAKGVTAGNYKNYTVVESAKLVKEGSVAKASTEQLKRIVRQAEDERVSAAFAMQVRAARAELKKRGVSLKDLMHEGHKVLPAIDRERYPEIPGLEGPFRTLNGGVVYYDPKEGAYYDKDRDMYLSYDEFRQMDTDYSGMKDERDIPVKEEDDDRDELTKKLFPRKSPKQWDKEQKERAQARWDKELRKPRKPSRSREWGAYKYATEADGNDTYAVVSYEYSEDWWSIEVYKNGEKVADDDGYFGANETGNPLVKKFVDIVKSVGLNPEGLPIVDSEGTHGVFKNNRFNWNADESKFDPYAELAKMAGTPKNPDKKDFDAVAHLAKSKKAQKALKDSLEPVKFNGKRFTNYKRFDSEERANAFLEKNEAYGVIGEKDGYVYVAKNADLGENKSVNEDISAEAHHMERDHEVQMARSDLYKTANYAIKLHSILKGISEEQGLEGWMQAKITKASDYLSSVFHALEYDQLERSQSEPIVPTESAEKVDETTTAGGIATAPMPMGKMIKRKKK